MKRLCARDVTKCHKHYGTLTGQEMTHKQDVHKKSGSSFQRVYRGSEHVQRQHASSDHTACAGWAVATNMLQKLLTTQSATVSHGCARSLLKPCSTNSNRSIHVFLSQTFVASMSRSTLSVGSHAALRLVPIVLTLQALLACSSRHRHRCRIPY